MCRLRLRYSCYAAALPGVWDDSKINRESWIELARPRRWLWNKIDPDLMLWRNIYRFVGARRTDQDDTAFLFVVEIQLAFLIPGKVPVAWIDFAQKDQPGVRRDLYRRRSAAANQDQTDRND